MGNSRATDKELVEALGREDYYKILKFKKNKPEDKLKIRWQSLRAKWAILHYHNKL